MKQSEIIKYKKPLTEEEKRKIEKWDKMVDPPIMLSDGNLEWPFPDEEEE
jgi:hypothetical protein